MEIEKIHSQAGYVEFCDFINSELTNPTSGLHSEIVTDLANTVLSTDYRGVLIELYSDRLTYWGCMFVSGDYKAIVIRQGACVYANVTPVDVADLFSFNPDGSLLEFYSESLTLYGNLSGDPEKTFTIGSVSEFGTDVFYGNLKQGDLVEQSGVLSGKISKDQGVGTYMIKVDRLAYAVLEMRGARSSYTTFQVQVTETTFVDFSYSKLGAQMFVQDTEISRKSIVALIKEGVIFATL